MKFMESLEKLKDVLYKLEKLAEEKDVKLERIDLLKINKETL